MFLHHAVVGAAFLAWGLLYHQRNSLCALGMAVSVSWLDSPALWSRWKYLNNYWMYFLRIWDKYPLYPEDQSQWLCLSPLGPPADQRFHLSSGIQYLNIYEIDWHKIVCRHTWFPDDVSYGLWWPSDCSSSTLMKLTFVVLSKMSWPLLDRLPWHLVETLMFSLREIAITLVNPLFLWSHRGGQNFNVSNTLV